METDDILTAIGSTEASDFNEFCRGLGSNIPQERSEWASLFRELEQLERDGLIEVSRLNGRIDTMILTSAGAVSELNWMNGEGS